MVDFLKEEDLYPSIKNWLENFLNNRHRAIIKSYISARKQLSRLIDEENLFSNLPSEWNSWDIYVDIVAFILSKKQTSLAFVECKNNSITLRDLSQLIGYSRVAMPKYSFLLSPQGISDSLKTLLLTYNRLDVLNYGFKEGKISDSIIIAKWNADANNIDFDTIITGTGNRIGNL